MPRKIVPKLCACGCQQMTRGGEYLPGHDTQVYSAIIKQVGGITNLRKIVEYSLGEEIIIHHKSSPLSRYIN